MNGEIEIYVGPNAVTAPDWLPAPAGPMAPWPPTDMICTPCGHMLAVQAP